jgi:cation diffusion facilitator CzcD-associated flavoprotein CzcO
MSEAKSVAIVGAGPVGLAAAAHVLERGLRPIVLEAGNSVGHAVRQWGHVQLFSPWEYNIDRAAARLLASVGWNSPEPDLYPTGNELLERYLEPLAAKTVLRTYIQTSSRSLTSAASASTSSRPRAGRPPRSKSAIRTGKAPKSCGRMP